MVHHSPPLDFALEKIRACRLMVGGTQNAPLSPSLTPAATNPAEPGADDQSKPSRRELLQHILKLQAVVNTLSSKVESLIEDRSNQHSAMDYLHNRVDSGIEHMNKRLKTGPPDQPDQPGPPGQPSTVEPEPTEVSPPPMNQEQAQELKATLEKKKMKNQVMATGDMPVKHCIR